MPPTPQIDPTLPLDELLRRAAAAGRRGEQVRLLDALAARTRQGYDAMRVFQALAAVQPNGSRLALEYVARMSDPIPPAILLFAAQALQDRSNPVGMRLTVAGKLLAALPDTDAAVGPVVRAVTAGLSRSRTLQRMIELQGRVDRCATLDRMVAASEQKVRLRCPKCRRQFLRPAFIRHLWDEHRLIFDRGTAVDPKPAVEQAVTGAVTATDGPATDQPFDESARYFPQSTPEQVLQAVASRQMASGHPVPDSLTRAAADQNAGLCPSCLNPVPDPIPPVPPPLAVGGGRLSGDGYAVEVIDKPTGRTVRVTTPKEGEEDVPPAFTRRFDPRAFGVLVAAPLLLAAVVAVGVLPQRFGPPVLYALLAGFAGWVVYLIARYARPPLPNPDATAVDAAWREIAPRRGAKKSAARWLTRLCRASIGRGDPTRRARELYEVVENAAVWADKGGVYLPLFAAARLLQVCDNSDMGRDRVSGLLDVFDPFFLGELPAAYAEAAAEIVTTDAVLTPADARRFAALLTSLAFDASLTPHDLIRVLRFLPYLRVLFGTPTADGLKAAYVIWKGRRSDLWAEAGHATTVFDLARTAPGACRRLLTAHPDALLRLDLPDAAVRELGEVVLTPRGVIAADKVLAEPGGEAEVVRSPRGSGWMLALGAQRINLDRKLDWNTVDTLVRWIRFRSDKLLPQAEAADRVNADRVRQVLAPLVRTCPLCHAECVCRSGRVGEPWPVA